MKRPLKLVSILVSCENDVLDCKEPKLKCKLMCLLGSERAMQVPAHSCMLKSSDIHEDLVLIQLIIELVPNISLLRQI